MFINVYNIKTDDLVNTCIICIVSYESIAHEVCIYNPGCNYCGDCVADNNGY